MAQQVGQEVPPGLQEVQHAQACDVVEVPVLMGRQVGGLIKCWRSCLVC